MAGVKLKKIEKTYPNGFKAVHGIDLDIEDGEFMVFVGPSGCAKSTTLRMIAGLESNTGGDIWIGDQCVNGFLPKDRGISMVFQNYALYPHMTTYENMAFGLKNMRYPKDEIHARVMDAADKLEITDLLDRKPKEMSGGQCQRVAVGRAIVRKPEVFLFDEPLSNLDAKLRVTMRVSLMELHRQLKAEGVSSTMIYVTHDQVEAMTMGDRICVLNKGNVMQVDTPINLYHYPDNKFVAGFIGSPSMNLLHVDYHSDSTSVNLGIGSPLAIPAHLRAKMKHYNQDKIWFGLRSEHILVERNASDSNIPAYITNVERMGNENLLHCKVNGDTFVVRSPSTTDWLPQVMEEVYLRFDMNEVHLFADKTEESLIIRHQAQLNQIETTLQKKAS
ncbi:sn-glycerol-3-phosphate ABC transporter ATP-binding protein UgpC [Vibrio sp. SS-MA-C1-2]|uniref:ABC transporter ATP-binding protein n=1 Tax=Vibrio sp. SS-MA-C1-2 TaxID=2908646 RepID=UPI001F4405FF|nr:sn-glycerol-3-phosphate ABC transporter ATP-binding protein UgpC [Vibrio sp. SS-MA-C1-2]UJF18497.1 sn-glycerol-3-phosphate ABC transporter ATP-binding protein UgpC [Vibrio sp. SS-MA-C1-2]